MSGLPVLVILLVKQAREQVSLVMAGNDISMSEEAQLL